MVVDEKAQHRFWEKVDKRGPTDCWDWCAAYYVDGYGAFRLNGRTVRAHRVSYMLFYGEIPLGMEVCHHCDNPKCVNPEHFFLGTQKDNIQDACKKGHMRGSPLYGSHNGRAKLHEEDIRNIRKTHAKGGVTFTQLGVVYGVAHSTIGRIVNRKMWKRVS